MHLVTQDLIACGKLPAGSRRTSHGLRAYFVTALRSQGVDDRHIAAQIGDKSGASIIESTYGALPPNWADTSVGKIDFLPVNRPPAWAISEFDTEESCAKVLCESDDDSSMTVKQ